MWLRRSKLTGKDHHGNSNRPSEKRGVEAAAYLDRNCRGPGFVGDRCYRQSDCLPRRVRTGGASPRRCRGFFAPRCNRRSCARDCASPARFDYPARSTSAGRRRPVHLSRSSRKTSEPSMLFRMPAPGACLERWKPARSIGWWTSIATSSPARTEGRRWESRVSCCSSLALAAF